MLTRPRWPVTFLLVACLIPGHLLGWAVEWTFVFASAALGVWSFPQFSQRYPAVARGGLITVGTLTAIAAGGYVITALGGRFDSGPRDIIDIFKPVLVFFVCTAALAFGRPTLQSVRNALVIVLLYSIAVFLVMYLRIPGFFDLAQWLYSDTKTNIGEYIVRLSIPFENPNFLGLVAVLALILGLNFSAKPAGLLVVCALVVAGLSGSRTAWLTSAVVLLCYMVGHLATLAATRRLPSVASVLMICLLIGGAVYLLPGLSESYDRLSSLLDLLVTLDFSQDASYAERIAMRQEGLQLMAERPWFGWGAYKYSIVEVLDNQYFALMLRYGIVGVGVLLISMTFLFLRYRATMAEPGLAFPAYVMWLVVMGWLWNGNFIENIRIAVIITMVFVATTNRLQDAD